MILCIQKLYVNGRKISFFYKIPSPNRRRYLDIAVNGADTAQEDANDVGLFLEKV